MVLTYEEMVLSIAKFTAIIIIIVLVTFIKSYPLAYQLYESLSLGLFIEWHGLSLGLAILYLPAIWYFFEVNVRLHNIISSLFGLRKNYDSRIIIKEFMDLLDLNFDLIKIKPISDKILENVFYPYFGFYIENCIDKHLLNKAHRGLLFFWICQNVLFISLLLTSIGLVISLRINYFQTWNIIMIVVTYLAYKSLVVTSREEVAKILSDPLRKEVVHKYLEAISDAL